MVQAAVYNAPIQALLAGTTGTATACGTTGMRRPMATLRFGALRKLKRNAMEGSRASACSTSREGSARWNSLMAFLRVRTSSRDGSSSTSLHKGGEQMTGAQV